MTLLVRRQHFPIALLLTAALAVGLLTLPHYGESWDEADIYRYSNYAIDAYRYLLHPADLPEFDTNLNLYGPGYYVAANLLARLFTTIHPAWSLIEAWHLVYFVTFLAGAVALYLLCTRWMGTAAAVGATLLFLSQPLLWGHAFINPKDTPFMALFTAAIYLGFKMTDRFQASSRPNVTCVLAAVLLGFTSAFRVLGPLAGLIVVGFAACKLRSKAVVPISLYVGIAAASAYLTWPFLWGAPLSRYLVSVKTMAEFPFASSILFADGLYKANQLPKTYFPTLLGIQLTEPALLLMAAGIVMSAVGFWKKATFGPLLLFLAWFLAPTLIIIGTGSPLYDNARQLYFLLPPLFVVAGLALDKLFSVLTQPAARAVVLLLSALPGILLAVRLHPYEYVYYNAFVGGTGGAYRHYEMDYWGLSFKEIADYLNSRAAKGARVLVYGPEQVVQHYARPDLKVHVPGDNVAKAYDYVVLLTRSNVDERRCTDAQTIYSVGRRGAVFSLLKRIPGGAECQ